MFMCQVWGGGVGECDGGCSSLLISLCGPTGYEWGSVSSCSSSWLCVAVLSSRFDPVTKSVRGLVDVRQVLTKEVQKGGMRCTAAVNHDDRNILPTFQWSESPFSSRLQVLWVTGIWLIFIFRPRPGFRRRLGSRDWSGYRFWRGPGNGSGAGSRCWFQL